MAGRRKTWREKFAARSAPEVEVLPKPYAGMGAGQKMLVSTPTEIDGYLRSIRLGTARSMSDLRSDLAKGHAADGVCPMSTSIFLRIVSEVALEELAEGRPLDAVAPFWRVVEPTSSLAQKLSCGPDWIRERRTAEGL